MSKSINYTGEAFNIFFKSVKIYLINLPDFLKYMAFPVLGIFFGMFLILCITYLLTQWMQTPDVSKYFLNNFLFTMIVLLISVIPGFLLLCKAFLDYIVAMVALSRAGFDLVATDKLVNDLKSYNSIIEYREAHYFMLILILSLIYGVLSFPLFIILECVFFLYTCLAIQAFAHDDRLNAFDAIKKCFLVIPGHVLSTIILLSLLGIITYIAVPVLLCWGLEVLDVIKYLNIPTYLIVQQLPFDILNQVFADAGLSYQLNIDDISKMITTSFIATAVTMFLLPIRSIACALWYDKLYSGEK